MSFFLLLQVYASYNYRRDLTVVVKVPGMLSRARSLSRDEAETQEADVGKGDAGVSVHPPTMRQAVAWELAMRNIRQSEVSIASASVMLETRLNPWLQQLTLLQKLLFQ